MKKARNKALPLKEAQNDLHQNRGENEDKSPRQTLVEFDTRGIPHLLLAIKSEPLNVPLTLKLWPSLATYINQHGGSILIRQAIIEKLERFADKPTPAVCSQCLNLTSKRKEPFCLVLCAYLDKKLLDQPFQCDCFSPRTIKEPK